MTTAPLDGNNSRQLKENDSPMHIRTFRAANLQEALEQIRQQMGSDAAVLHTRQVRDGWMGWLGRTYVEVTAGLRDEEDSIPNESAEQSIDSRSVPEMESRLLVKDVPSLADPALPLPL